MTELKLDCDMPDRCQIIAKQTIEEWSKTKGILCVFSKKEFKDLKFFYTTGKVTIIAAAIGVTAVGGYHLVKLYREKSKKSSSKEEEV